jgi:DNA-binding NarL/FixJ family response regulator
MEVPSEVLVASASPIYARALQDLLEHECADLRCRIFGDAGPVCVDGPSEPDVVLVAARHWEEFGAWLPALRRRFPLSPWLVLGDRRFAGLFLSVLDFQPCALVPESATPEQLRDQARALLHRQTKGLSMELRALFVSGAAACLSHRPFEPPSPMEIECACAVSLGLSDRQSSSVLKLEENQVRSQVEALLRKLRLEDREDLGRFVRRALATPSSRLDRRGVMADPLPRTAA